MVPTSCVCRAGFRENGVLGELVFWHPHPLPKSVALLLTEAGGVVEWVLLRWSLRSDRKQDLKALGR